MHIHLEENKIN